MSTLARQAAELLRRQARELNAMADTIEGNLLPLGEFTEHSDGIYTMPMRVHPERVREGSAALRRSPEAAPWPAGWAHVDQPHSPSVSAG